MPENTVVCKTLADPSPHGTVDTIWMVPTLSFLSHNTTKDIGLVLSRSCTTMCSISERKLHNLLLFIKISMFEACEK